MNILELIGEEDLEKARVTFKQRCDTLNSHPPAALLAITKVYIFNLATRSGEDDPSFVEHQWLETVPLICVLLEYSQLELVEKIISLLRLATIESITTLLYKQRINPFYKENNQNISVTIQQESRSLFSLLWAYKAYNAAEILFNKSAFSFVDALYFYLKFSDKEFDIDQAKKIFEYSKNNLEALNFKGLNNVTPFYLACKLGKVTLVKEFLKLPNVDFNVQTTGTQDTALTVAITVGKWKVVALLVNHPQINISLKNKKDKDARMLIEEKTFTASTPALMETYNKIKEAIINRQEKCSEISLEKQEENVRLFFQNIMSVEKGKNLQQTLQSIIELEAQFFSLEEQFKKKTETHLQHLKEVHAKLSSSKSKNSKKHKIHKHPTTKMNEFLKDIQPIEKFIKLSKNKFQTGIGISNSENKLDELKNSYEKFKENIEAFYKKHEISDTKLVNIKELKNKKNVKELTIDKKQDPEMVINLSSNNFAKIVEEDQGEKLPQSENNVSEESIALFSKVKPEDKPKLDLHQNADLENGLEFENIIIQKRKKVTEFFKKTKNTVVNFIKYPEKLEQKKHETKPQKAFNREIANDEVKKAEISQKKLLKTHSVFDFKKIIDEQACDKKIMLKRVSSSNLSRSTSIDGGFFRLSKKDLKELMNTEQTSISPPTFFDDSFSLSDLIVGDLGKNRYLWVDEMLLLSKQIGEAINKLKGENLYALKIDGDSIKDLKDEVATYTYTFTTPGGKPKTVNAKYEIRHLDPANKMRALLIPIKSDDGKTTLYVTCDYLNIHKSSTQKKANSIKTMQINIYWPVRKKAEKDAEIIDISTPTLLKKS